MNLGQELRETLPELQAHAESMMADTCVIEREPDGDSDWVIGEDGIESPAPWVRVYAGRCKVQSYMAYEQDVVIAATTETKQRYLIHVPVAAGPFAPGDRVTVTSMGNRTFRVAGPHRKTWQTAQRLLVDEVW